MRTTKAFLRAGHLPTLAGAFLYFDISFMIWVLLGALGNHVAGEFGMTPAQKGLMTAIPLLGGSVLRLVFGHLTDTIGPRRTALIGMAGTFVPLLLGWLWARSIPQVYLVGLLLGVAGASFAAALPLASRWYPAKYQGLAMGIAGAGNSGTLFSTLFAPRLAEAWGWPGVFGMAIVPLTAVAVFFALCTKEAPGVAQRKRGPQFLATLVEPDTLRFSLFYAVTFGGFVGLASFLSIFLRDQYGVSKVAAGDWTSLCVVAGSFMRPVGGWLADRFGGIRVLIVIYGAVALVGCCVAQLPPLGVAVGWFFIMMGCLGVGNGAVFQLVPQRYGKHVGVATGILGAAGGVGGFFLPTTLGWAKESAGSYGVGLAAFSGVAAVTLVCLLLSQRSWVGVWVGRHGRARSLAGAGGREPSERGVVGEPAGP
jgi:NNP family nitrate/nitrite transporter-like MFS transporter